MTLSPEDLARLRRLALFAPADQATFDRLADAADLRTMASGLTIAAEGQADDVLYVLLDGMLELSGVWNARDTTLALLRPVSTFALASVILRTPVLTTARTVARSRVLTLPGDAWREAMRHDAGLAHAAMEELAGCYNSVVRVLKNCKLRGAQERLANYLLSLHQRADGATTFVLPCPKRVLASLLDMTPENLSRAFASLAAYGVEVDGPRISIAQPAILAGLAKPDILIEGHPAPAGAWGQAERERRRGDPAPRNST
ncbi:helix-turn-helix domain-containing protein [uncultured Caulobacter sp.]|jgi:CRP/FNR family transcriptional regulator, transcriptional activator FtrB|uniref:transcriptional activator FtrB n=1 Tax=uncultured Caulobacter sp. TaxID=158749 RepID=UPI0026109A32|nr:helix-turn-helix domain-containing protein [uncultured Caulobacter sp.]